MAIDAHRETPETIDETKRQLKDAEWPHIWVVYVAIGFESEWNMSGDDDAYTNDADALGRSSPNKTIIFAENIRDSFGRYKVSSGPDDIEHLMAQVTIHEVGHQLLKRNTDGRVEGHREGSVMSKFANIKANELKFDVRDIVTLRSLTGAYGDPNPIGS